MSYRELPSGVWPTVLTLFKEDGSIDYSSMENLIEWYISKGSSGLFAICQSSEIFFLSRTERTELLKFIIRIVDERIPVVASGHVSDKLDEQVAELNEVAEYGIDSLVLISNRLAPAGAHSDVWLRNFDQLVAKLNPNVPLGMYECPYPHKVLLDDRIINRCLDEGRFNFFKDTSCDIETIKKRVAQLQGSNFKLYNANASFLLESLQQGAAGYCGIMCNFHPELYTWLLKNQDHPNAEDISNFLGVFSCIEARAYPVCAKYHLSSTIPGMSLYTRTRESSSLLPSFKNEVEQLEKAVSKIIHQYKIQ